MIFSSLIYILFLAVIVMLYWKLPQRFRIPMLLLASYIFYASWEPPWGLVYAPLLFLNTLFFYGLSLAIGRGSRWHKKFLLITGIASQLGLLAYFKYAGFLGDTLTALLSFFRLPAQQPEFNIFMPLAISLTTFILISYVIDVYRDEEKPDTSFLLFATYVAFFPHLIAGPIVRARELLHQFDQLPSFRHENLIKGIDHFAAGYFLKVFVADILGTYVNQVYGHPELQAFNTNWVASYAFSVQLFCDFFGYTLMAQGTALMMGYTLPENFNAPYFAKNMREFWKRWHISLSRWLKDYLYIPLGGNRQGKLATYRNLFITMGLGGLWHGANWTFVMWGLAQGLMLCLYKIGKELNINRFIPALGAILLTFHGVVLARVFFRAQSMQDAGRMLATMFQPWIWKVMIPPDPAIFSETIFMGTGTAMVLIILFLGGHCLIRLGRERIRSAGWTEFFAASAYATLFFFILTLGGSQQQEFIYFQF